MAAGVCNVGSRTQGNPLLQCMYKKSGRENMSQINLFQNFRSSPGITRNLRQLKSFTFSTVSTRNSVAKTSTSSMTSLSLGVTGVLSHLWAGDLHILRKCIDKQAQFDFQSQRSISGLYSKRSATHYYDVLGLRPNATQNQIKTAYYKMSKLHHPDVTECPQSHSLFTEVNEAYEILGNLRKRRMYDRGVFSHDARTDSVVDEEPKDYTKAYGKNSNFERGNRPPPPTGRSKIYNFDEFYRQHYNEMRERRALQYKEFLEHRARMDRENEQKLLQFSAPLVMTIWAIFLVTGALVLFNNNSYDRDLLPRSPKKS